MGEFVGRDVHIMQKNGAVVEGCKGSFEAQMARTNGLYLVSEQY